MREYEKVYQEVMDANECWKCLAPVGDWCRTPLGNPKSRYHQVRWDQLHLKAYMADHHE